MDMPTDFEPVTPLAVGLGASLRAADRVSVVRGQASGLSFSLERERENAGARLTFRVAGSDLWSQSDLSGGDLANLLRGLACAWDALVVEEVYPHSLTPEHPSQLEPKLEALLKDVNEVDLLVKAYRASHDLSAWMGSDFPSLWFMREGLLMVVEASGIVRRLGGGDVLRTLEHLGDAIAELTKEAEPSARIAWRNRNDTSQKSIDRLLRLSMGRSEGIVRQLIERKIIPFPRRRSDAMRGLDAVQAAARMWPARLPVASLERVAAEIRAVSRRDTAELDQLSEAALAALAGSADKPARIGGAAIALWLRGRLGLNYTDRADPQGLLDRWGVLIRRVELVLAVEAVSFWGDQHGPGILLNPNSRKARIGKLDQRQLNGAMRFSLAHEICHLLVDRKGSLPVAEVLGGATPSRPENRANVFAAHFLLPLRAVEEAYIGSANVEDCLETLTSAFGVSRTLAGAQLKWRYYGSDVLSPADWRVINALAPSGRASA
jgi:hypothetical protein